jgi:hypothetical protein
MQAHPSRMSVHPALHEGQADATDAPIGIKKSHFGVNEVVRCGLYQRVSKFVVFRR